MKKMFICSLCRGGILGGALYVDSQAVTFRTNKLTVDPKYRNLILPMKKIQSVAWTQILFPVAKFHMESGEIYSVIIFNKAGFCKAYEEYRKTE